MHSVADSFEGLSMADGKTYIAEEQSGAADSDFKVYESALSAEIEMRALNESLQLNDVFGKARSADTVVLLGLVTPLTPNVGIGAMVGSIKIAANSARECSTIDFKVGICAGRVRGLSMRAPVVQHFVQREL